MHFLDAATRGPAPDFRRTRRAAPGLCHAGATGMLLRWALAACCAVPAPAAFAQATQAAAAAAATPASQAAPAARSGPASPFAAARFSRVIGAGGVPLNVVELGDPALPGVLFIHGFRQSILSWSVQFASDLSRRCHLVAFDLRGHGNSGSPWQPAAYDSAQPWGDDVAAVIAATGLKKPLVVGWSFGGNVAMDFASRHPELPVAGYLLTGTAGGTSAAAVPPPPPADAPPRRCASARGWSRRWRAGRARTPPRRTRR